jgi:hypothetical protein
MGMLRKIVIVGAAVALMPSPPDEAQTADQIAAGNTSVFSYVAAASETVADLRGFCERNAFACETAGKMAVTLEGKAKYSAKLLYEWANEATQPVALQQSDEVVLAKASPQNKVDEAPPALRLVSASDEMALENLIKRKSKEFPEEG